MLARVFSTAAIVFISFGLFAVFSVADEEDSEEGRALLDRLSAGELIPLSREEFPNLKQICIVGWDRWPFPPPQSIDNVCPRLEDHSAVGIITEGSCETIISGSLWREYLIDFAMDGEINCASIPSQNHLIVYEGIGGMRDRLDIAPAN